jgi:glycine/D-amino acid oxidase-like deaminating enzyme
MPSSVAVWPCLDTDQLIMALFASHLMTAATGHQASPSGGASLLDLGVADVAVVGGGIAGCAIAYELAREGIETAVIERGELNREASGSTAGNFHIQLRRRRTEEAELSRDGRRLVAAILRLHLEAGKRWVALEDELRHDLGVRVGGGLMVAEDGDQLRALEVKSRLERELGLSTEVVTGTDLKKLAPSMADGLAGAVHCREEGFANPLLAVPAFARAASAAGARFLARTTVTEIRSRPAGGFLVQTTSGRLTAGRVVNAAGALADNVARTAGSSLPVKWRINHVNVSEEAPPMLTQMVTHAERLLTLKQTQYGTFVIGGGWPGELAPHADHKRVIFDSVVGNLNNAVRVMPHLRHVKLLRTWAGRSPAADGRTCLIGEDPRLRDMYVMVPLGTGFTLAPILARLLAELIRSGTTSLPIRPFSIDNYAGAVTSYGASSEIEQ